MVGGANRKVNGVRRVDRLGEAFWKLLNRSEVRELARSERLVATAGAHEPVVRDLTDQELRADVAALRTAHTRSGRARSRHALVRFLALAREASVRALGMRPFDVQLLGAERMRAGKVVEMDTGEGKTLAGAITAAGFVLQGRSVHVVSVNDYLARRDAEWMRPLYDLLGVSVGWIGSASTADERRLAYQADVTYAPISELGFDVLRDRLATDLAGLVSPRHDVALVDEADSVLIDEARVPLVLAGAAEGIAPATRITDVVRALRPGVHYQTDEDGHSVSLTEDGTAAVEAELDGIDLYSADHAETTLTQVNVALHARVLLQRDVHYIVRDGRVHLINESRGRIARLQRWPDGLHAAVEAKEGLPVTDAGEILDSMTVQALVGRYTTLCGMTGTALVARDQFDAFHRLRVWQIPPNKPCVRVDEPDRVYATIEQKEAAIVELVGSTHRTGQPILIGTQDVAESERLAVLLEKAGVGCTVLNAKNDAQEAAIIAEAGRYGAVTVSTQMAGRGTDIWLGGSDQSDYDRVVALGGLCVVGTGRHLSGRLDKQLRGRAGRQGDPGRSVFFASPEDELVLTYAPDAKPPTHVEDDGRVRDKDTLWVMGHAQRVADATMLELHRNTSQYNGVIHHQRRPLDEQRDRVLRTDQALRDLETACAARLATLRTSVSEATLVDAARLITLYHLDRCWAEHLAFLAELREAIHFRVLAKQVPIVEFNREAIAAFERFRERVAERSADSFDAAPITEDGFDPDQAGLRRPNATWTYMVHENPFGTEIDRIFKAFSGMFRKR